MKILIGGSPCTHWSIAQTKNRETEASGIGWELFLNYRIARDKYHPDYFLYENNKSMSPAIRAQITAELGVEPVLINSALVSAQNRQRLYWVGKREPDGTYSQVRVEQPEDKGILLRDILESGVCWREKGYALTASNHSATAEDMIARRQRNGAAEPIRIGTIENDAKKQDFDSQQYRVYSPDGKSVTLCGNGGGVGAKTGLYAVPVPVNETVEGKAQCLRATYYKDGIRNMVGNTVDRKTCVAIPVCDGAATGLYAVPAPVEYEPLHSCDVVITDQNIRCTYKDRSGTAQGYTVTFDDMKAPSVIAGHAHKMKIIERATGKETPVYEVRGGFITIKGKQYHIKLADGFYIIRKLTVTECKRLQTVPDTYAFPVSDTQAYKMLGNGWTVDVIAHIMSHFTGLTEEPVEVLSMYDGMSCGHIALDKLGVNVTAYYATEIDKYAVQTTQHNFPETVQLGDAFQVRNEEWRLRRAAEVE
jgi:DNA (cytosine-5)-methyltransferase 3A